MDLIIGFLFGIIFSTILFLIALIIETYSGPQDYQPPNDIPTFKDRGTPLYERDGISNPTPIQHCHKNESISKVPSTKQSNN